MKIKKIAQSIGVVGKTLNNKSTSQNDTYSCNYINNLMEVGQISIVGTSGAWAWAEINYKKTYDTIPSVFVQCADNASVGVSTVVINRTTTGCSVGIYNHSYTRRFNYLVVETN